MTSKPKLLPHLLPCTSSGCTSRPHVWMERQRVEPQELIVQPDAHDVNDSLNARLVVVAASRTPAVRDVRIRTVHCVSKLSSLRPIRARFYFCLQTINRGFALAVCGDPAFRARKGSC